MNNLEMEAARAQVASARELRRIADALEDIAKVLKIGGGFSAGNGNNLGTKEKDDE